ncbi:hypothetical protein IQ07DRAFT_476181, partial [Pyrenochaeta sp. DS3sAY3a]
ECVICFKPFWSQFPKFAACTHAPEVCLGCFLAYLNSQLDTTIWNLIPCPSLECNAFITHADVNDYATRELFDRFDRMSLMEHLGRERSFHLCLAPECSYGQYHDSTNGHLFQCADCGFRQCTVHNVGFHNGETCEQYDTRTKAQSTALVGDQTYVKSRSIPCPKCKVPIVKAGGCDHMTCSRCRTEFCYICSTLYSVIWNVGNSAHDPEC